MAYEKLHYVLLVEISYSEMMWSLWQQHECEESCTNGEITDNF